MAEGNAVGVSVTDPLDIYTPRGVADDVRDERGYRRYARGDAGPALAVDERLAESPRWLATTLSAPGWVMPRPSIWRGLPNDITAALDRDGVPVFPEPYAQLRPDWPVGAATRRHTHGAFKHTPGDCLCGRHHDRPPVVYSTADAGDGLWRRAGFRWLERMGQRERRAHEQKVCDWVGVLDEVIHELAELGIAPLAGPDEGGRYLWPTGHLDPRTGELVVPFDGFHTHLDWAKYRYPSGRGKAAGLSTHPRIIASGFAAPEGLMFLALEGVLKCDAVVSAEWPALEVGSVTLWSREAEELVGGWGADGQPEVDRYVANELEVWARYVVRPVGARVAVVCDSDWVTNERVRRQVALVVDLLAEAGVEAVGCAPPQGKPLGWVNRDGMPMHSKLGVDDYLGELPEGERHEALLAMPVQAPQQGAALEAFVARLPGNAAGRRTARLLLEALQRTSGPTGVVPFPATELGATIGKERTAVWRAKRALERADALRELVPEEKVSTGSGVITEPALLQLSPEVWPRSGTTMLRDWFG